MNKRIGVLGGSFDPPTLAHEHLGEIFLKALNLDEVRYVVARQNPLKYKITASAQHRWNMIQMMIKPHEKFSASDIETQEDFMYEYGELIHDSETPPSFAYNTLKAFQMFEPHSDFIFLGGSDITRSFYNWHKAEKIIEEFQLGIAIRPPHNLVSTLDPIKKEHQKAILIVDTPSMPDISSTDVRSFFELKEYDRAKSLMREDIYEYALNNQLY